MVLHQWKRPSKMERLHWSLVLRGVGFYDEENHLLETWWFLLDPWVNVYLPTFTVNEKKCRQIYRSHGSDGIVKLKLTFSFIYIFTSWSQKIRNIDGVQNWRSDTDMWKPNRFRIFNVSLLMAFQNQAWIWYSVGFGVIVCRNCWWLDSLIQRHR